MEALLIAQWLGDLDAVEILDEASLTLVRDRIRALEAPELTKDRALLVASELGRNHLRHARRGRIAARAIARDDGGIAAIGVEVVAADLGAGVRDVAAALDAPARSGPGSLGVGIGAVKRLATEVDIDVRLGEGTCFRARLFDAAVPRRPEVGIYGRAYPGEDVSGDHAAFTRTGDSLSLIVCDGLGHGPSAREASDAAVDVWSARVAEAPAKILEACHRELTRTRGVVMASARVDRDRRLELASAGNVETLVTAFRRTRRFGGTSATIGGRGGPLKVRTEEAGLEPEDVLVLMTDGLQTRATLEDEPLLLRTHPVAIAQHLLARFARPNDDALVLVVR